MSEFFTGLGFIVPEIFSADEGLSLSCLKRLDSKVFSTRVSFVLLLLPSAGLLWGLVILPSAVDPEMEKVCGVSN